MLTLRNLTSIFLLSTISGCLQEPAPIAGKRNYYLEDENLSRESKNKTQKEEHVFEDEEKVSESLIKALDPYTSDDLNSRENTPRNSVKDESKNKVRDWNSVFSEPKTQTLDKNPVEIVNTKPDKQVANEVRSPVTNENGKNTLNGSTKQEIQGEENTLKSSNKAKLQVQTEKKNELCCINKPAKYVIQTKYGKAKDSDLSDGTIFRVDDKNIKSMGDGKVIYVDDDQSSTRKTIIVKHANGLIVSYSYSGGTKAKVHKEVKTGEILGEIDSEKNLLYCTVRYNGKTIDPESIMK